MGNQGAHRQLEPPASETRSNRARSRSLSDLATCERLGTFPLLVPSRRAQNCVAMKNWTLFACLILTAHGGSAAAPDPAAFPADPKQGLERTVFQTAAPWSSDGNLPADVAIAYGIDPTLPQRVQTWRNRGYKVHMMTGASWGEYHDYFHGRWDGKNHEDEIQTVASGRKMAHPGGGGGFYMCPTASFGEFLWQGIRRGLDAGVDAVHLEESEYWAKTGYEAAFKREWQDFYQEAWQPPQSSEDAQWRASKLKYHLFRRVLQQIFAHVQDYNREHGRHVRCYVPTHSLVNYAHWRVISAESSLASIAECDGYIGQGWTGSSRVPNRYQSEMTTWNDIRERPFETAFLEYGILANLARATNRRLWVNGDPVEDDPKHDWADYRFCWEATLVGALFHPDIVRHEVAPWPERVFGGVYPVGARSDEKRPIPSGYATELQVVMRALADLDQKDVSWDCGTRGLGILMSDSLMFQRELPSPSDGDLSHVYGITLPLMKRGIPVTPVQLEYAAKPGFLSAHRVLFLSYHGQKPLSADVHDAIALWVQQGGVLVFVDDDTDPYNRVREWWNDQGTTTRLPRQHLFAAMQVRDTDFANAPSRLVRVGQGAVLWMKEDPANCAKSWAGSLRLVAAAQTAVAHASGLAWKTTSHMAVRRGPYVIGAGLDESPIDGPAHVITGRFVDLFDPELAVQRAVKLEEGKRVFLLDLDATRSPELSVLASAGKILRLEQKGTTTKWAVEGINGTKGIVLMACNRAPQSVELDGKSLTTWSYHEDEQLLYLRFPNEARPRDLVIRQ